MSLDKSISCCWFESDTRLGSVYVGFEATEAEQKNLAGPHRVFQQAALVSNSELFVQAIELWQKIDLDLMPCEQPDDSGIHLSLTLKAATDENNSDPAMAAVSQPNSARRIVAIFPTGSFKELTPLNDELGAVINIESSAMHLQVELDRFEISAEEFEALENGAVVVLPKSYESDWVIAAKSITPDLSFEMTGTVVRNNNSAEVVLSLPGNSAVSVSEKSNSEHVEDTDHHNHTVSVYCQNSCEVPINQLLGVSSNIQLQLNTSQLVLTSENRLVAHGALLAYGRGSVLAVNQMVAPG